MADYGRIADVSGGIDGTGGGQLSAQDGADIPARPSGAPAVEVGTWPPSSWGPKFYMIDVSGNRAGAVRPPGE